MKHISIKTVEDMVNKVPIEDLDIFLKDLKAWLTMHKTVGIVSETFGEVVAMNDTELKWIND